MKNKKFWLGMLILTLVFGMMVIGCEDEDTPEPYIPPPQPGATASNPIDRTENTNLGTMTSPASGWQQLLNSIESTGKYINLDLSACTMTGTSFNPDPSVTTGKKYIVSIILPTVATSIEAGTFSDPSFKDFKNLKSISGANIIIINDYSFVQSIADWNIINVDFPKATTIGKSAFYNTKLESVNFPKVITIGDSAFSSCSSLKNASFPLAETIGVDAFRFCSSLENISFPASAELGLSDGNYSNPFTYCRKINFTLTGTSNLSVTENGKALVRNSTILLAYPSASGNITMNNITSLDGSVFSGCFELTGINLPQVTSIGYSAFYYCSNIQDVSFPQATIIGSSAFSSCNRLQSASFPLVTTVGYAAFDSCSNLVTLNIPKVTKIERRAFSSTGNTELSITMGATAPSILDYSIFGGITTTKQVKVKVPLAATGYNPFSGSSVTVSGTNTTVNWANGFRGGGWNGYAFYTGSYVQGVDYINQNISLTIEQQ